MENETAPLGRSGAYAKGVARRQEILDKAIEVFAERGTHGTSLRQIAKTIGVSHAALLHYFDSREQLLVAVYDHAEKKAARSPEEAATLTAVGSMTDSAVKNMRIPGMVQLYTSLVALALEEDSTASKEHFTERFARLRTDTAEWFRRDQEAGLVRKDVDPEAAAAILIAASDGLQTQWLLDPEFRFTETLRAFESMLAP